LFRECATTATSATPGSFPSRSVAGHALSPCSDLPPAGLAQPVDTEDHETEGGEHHEEFAERLGSQREQRLVDAAGLGRLVGDRRVDHLRADQGENQPPRDRPGHAEQLDRKSTRLNSSHLVISYAVFCLKKKTK